MTADERDVLIEYLLMLGELDENDGTVTVDAQFDAWCQVRGEVVAGEMFYKSILAAAKVVHRLSAGGGGGYG